MEVGDSSDAAGAIEVDLNTLESLLVTSIRSEDIYIPSLFWFYTCI